MTEPHDAWSIEQAAQRIAAQGAEEDHKLANTVPGWSDPVKRQEGKAQVTSYLVRQYGMTPEELDAFTDHRLVVLAHKAMLYDELAENGTFRTRAVPKVSKQEADADVIKTLRDQFHKTGSIEDAAKLMQYLGG